MELVAERAVRVLEPLVEAEGYDLVDLEYRREGGRGVLRLFIDKPGGSVTLDDCQTVSEFLSPVLDVENIIEGRYFLEVSSPGINRRIKKKADFERFIGSKVKMQLRIPVNGQRKVTGIIEGVEGEEIVIRGGSPEAESLKKVPLVSIDRANLQVI